MFDGSLVAVVDDDGPLRVALVGLLRSLGCHAEDFAGARKLLEGDPGRFRCVVTDVHMPGMDGIELARALARLDPRPPVIMMTAVWDAGLEARALAIGAVGLLTKPFDAQELSTRLSFALHSCF